MGTDSGIGKATRGYDPSQDIVWLRSEIVQWIQGNLMEKWCRLNLLSAANITLMIIQGIYKTAARSRK